jgi:hypothetical protein
MSHHDHESEERYVRGEVRRFKQHLLTYLVVVGAMFMINLVTGGFWHGHFWFFWIAFFWGIAIAFQAARLFGDDIGRNWEDRMVSHIMARREDRPASPPPGPPPPRPPEPPQA